MTEPGSNGHESGRTPITLDMFDSEEVCMERMRATEVQHKTTLVMEFVLTVIALVSFLVSPLILVSLLISAISVLLCSQRILDIQYELLLSPIITGFIFPLVFTMSATWSRREQARSHFIKVRAACFNTYWTQSEWLHWMDTPTPDFDKRSFLPILDRCLKNIMINLIAYLRADGFRDVAAETRLHADIRALSHLTERMTIAWGKSHAGPPQVGRLRGLEHSITENAMHLRGIKDTKVPWGLKVFGYIAAVIGPVFLAPHFAGLGCAEDAREAGTCGYGGGAAYVSALFYALIVAALFRIVLDLEDPFDGTGYDDLRLLAMYRDYRSMVEIEPRTPPEDKMHRHESDAAGVKQMSTLQRLFAALTRQV